MENQGIRIVTVAGSVRPGSFTSKALNLVIDEAKGLPSVEVDAIEVASLDLDLPGAGPSRDAERIQNLVSQATGLVLATPEYHGSYSSVIKMVIENLGFPSVMSGKPIALLGVAAGQIGAIKALEHLRSVCSHVGGIVLPGPVSVAGVQQLFDDEGRCLDEAIEKRIRGLARGLVDYIQENLCPRMALEEMTRRGETQWMQHCISGSLT